MTIEHIAAAFKGVEHNSALGILVASTEVMLEATGLFEFNMLTQVERMFMSKTTSGMPPTGAHKDSYELKCGVKNRLCVHIIPATKPLHEYMEWTRRQYARQYPYSALNSDADVHPQEDEYLVTWRRLISRALYDELVFRQLRWRTKTGYMTVNSYETTQVTELKYASTCMIPSMLDIHANVLRNQHGVIIR